MKGLKTRTSDHSHPTIRLQVKAEAHVRESEPTLTTLALVSVCCEPEFYINMYLMYLIPVHAEKPGHGSGFKQISKEEPLVMGGGGEEINLD